MCFQQTAGTAEKRVWRGLCCKQRSLSDRRYFHVGSAVVAVGDMVLDEK